jgi:CHAD domain-containing protein
MTKSKWIEGLDCEATARAGAAFVLRAKLEEMCRLREAALDFSDIEGVHKMRVASRRLRSALRDFQPYLSKPVSPQRLKAVARALGAVRDEDVALEMVGELAAEADEEAREGIELLAARRRARREKARARLAAAISVAALGELREKFTVQLSRAAAEDGAGAAAGVERVAERRGALPLRFGDAGGRILRERFRELKGSARSLYRPFEVEPLHETRIRAKRLRYAIELFTQCWGEPVAPYAAEIAKLQKYLGELHDCDVWIDDLSRRLGRGARERGAGRQHDRAAERRAAAWLLRHFTKARAKHYGEALALWESWEAMDFAPSLAAAVEEARGRAASPAREPPAAEAAGGGGAAGGADKDEAAGAVDDPRAVQA